jgi:hypothetical protein
MHSISRFGLVFALLAALCLSAAAAVEERVKLPFGLNWGDAAEELENALKQAGANIAERKPAGDGGETWTVEGLKAQGVRRVIFTLHGGSLSAVELQYGSDQWDVWTFDEFMHRVRQGLETNYGAGKQLSRGRALEEDVLQTLVGYAWPVGGKSIQLVYFAAQDEKNAFRMISLHYKNDPPKEVARMEVRKAIAVEH